jgi:hypothetical protein
MICFRPSSRVRPGQAGLALLLGAALAGCGAGQGEVSGTVRYRGKPLPFGTIQFLGQEGVPCAGRIRPDGTFSVQVPAGAAKVIISCVDEARMSRFLRQRAGGHGRAAPPTLPAGGFSLIPRRYADWTASGLTVLVTDGQTVQDFDLGSN